MKIGIIDWSSPLYTDCSGTHISVWNLLSAPTLEALSLTFSFAIGAISPFSACWSTEPVSAFLASSPVTTLSTLRTMAPMCELRSQRSASVLLLALARSSHKSTTSRVLASGCFEAREPATILSAICLAIASSGLAFWGSTDLPSLSASLTISKSPTSALIFTTCVSTSMTPLEAFSLNASLSPASLITDRIAICARRRAWVCSSLFFATTASRALIRPSFLSIRSSGHRLPVLVGVDGQANPANPDDAGSALAVRPARDFSTA
mmetsp:Transcript_86197/g.228601  ORF Transcript_86197/g.228601 Transcript_86197/m.228601 type:complete len:264 (-) Transcript_86197:62-853(-)